MKSLVKRAQRGDDQAFVELIEENKQAMYKVAVGILKNDFDAADAIQQSILTCYEKLKELKKAQYFKTWLLRILINNCIIPFSIDFFFNAFFNAFFLPYNK